MSNNTEEKPFNIAICGVGAVGKTALTNRQDYIPTVEDSHPYEWEVYEFEGAKTKRTIKLDILDTAGQEEYSGLREEYMKKAEGFLLVYSIAERSSFEEVDEFYNQILTVRQEKKENEDIPMVLVANKCDLKNDRDVERGEGEEKANEWGIEFFEVSAKDNVNVEKSFDKLCQLIKVVRDNAIPEEEREILQPKSNKCCTIL